MISSGPHSRLLSTTHGPAVPKLHVRQLSALPVLGGTRPPSRSNAVNCIGLKGSLRSRPAVPMVPRTVSFPMHGGTIFPFGRLVAVTSSVRAADADVGRQTEMRFENAPSSRAIAYSIGAPIYPHGCFKTPFWCHFTGCHRWVPPPFDPIIPVWPVSLEPLAPLCAATSLAFSSVSPIPYAARATPRVVIPEVRHQFGNA